MPVDNDQQFAELAHSALQNKAPQLMPFVVGFQPLTSSDDGTRIVGMFGLSIGSNLFFIPVFFLKGMVKPLELIFDYTKDVFLPFTKEGITMVMKSGDSSLGGCSDDPKSGFSDMLAPNSDASRASFGSFSRGTDSFSKMASEIPGPSFFTRSVESLRPGSFLPAFLEKASQEELRGFKTLLENEEFAQVVHSKVGLDLIKSAYERSSKRILDGVEGEGEPATEHGGVNFVSVVPRANKKAILDKVPQDKLSKAIKDGYYIDDKRDSTAKLYNTQFSNQFTTPHKSGEFSFVREDGSLARALLLYSPHALLENQSTENCFLIEPGSLNCASIPVKDLEVSPVRRSEEALARVLAAGTTAKAMMPGRKYIIMTPDAKSWAGPVKVDTTRSTGSGTVHYKVTSHQCYGSAYLVAGLANVEKFKKVGNEVLVPGNAVAVDITETCDNLRTGRVGDLSNKLIHTGLEPVVMTHDGVEFDDGTGQKLDRTAAMRKLVVDKNLSEKDSEGVLDKAASEGKFSALIKHATPTFINDTESSDRPDSTKNMLESVEQVPQYSAEPQQSFQDPYLVPEERPHLPSIALTAAAVGSPEVFDGSVLVSLAETSSISDAANEYLPDLTKAIDRIGRLLFLLWWQHDKFRDKYSPAELTVLESDLKTLMKKLGELTFKLSSRSREG